MDSNDVDLREFQRLRTEIDNRTTISEAIVLGHITALGTGLSLLGTVPDVLLALSYVSSLLWLSWLAHTHQIYKLSGYIATELASKLPSRPDRPALYWEGYSRLIDWLGRDAYELTSQHRCVEFRKLDDTKFRLGTKISRFIALLFGAPPFILLVIYILFMHTCPGTFLTGRSQNECNQLSNLFFGARICLVIGSALVWFAAIYRYYGLLKTQIAIDKIVMAKMCQATQDPVEKK